MLLWRHKFNLIFRTFRAQLQAEAATESCSSKKAFHTYDKNPRKIHVKEFISSAHFQKYFSSILIIGEK